MPSPTNDQLSGRINWIAAMLIAQHKGLVVSDGMALDIAQQVGEAAWLQAVNQAVQNQLDGLNDDIVVPPP